MNISFVKRALIASFYEGCQALCLQMKIAFQNLGAGRTALKVRNLVTRRSSVALLILGLRFAASWVARQGATWVWQDQVELLRCKPFPVRFTATGRRTGAYLLDQDESLAWPASAPEAA
jgi:hypothetical protein